MGQNVVPGTSSLPQLEHLMASPLNNAEPTMRANALASSSTSSWRKHMGNIAKDVAQQFQAVVSTPPAAGLPQSVTVTGQNRILVLQIETYDHPLGQHLDL